MKFKETIEINLEKLIDTFIFERLNTSKKVIYEESLRHIYSSISPDTTDEAKVADQVLICILDYMEMVSKNVGNTYGLVLYPYKNVEDITLQDFTGDGTLESIFKFLNTFLNKNYLKNVYNHSLHLSILQFDCVVMDDLYTRFKFLRHFTNVHNLLCSSRPDLFENSVNSKTNAFTRLKILTRVGKDANNYSPTPNYTVSKFNNSKYIFPQASLAILSRNIELGTMSPTFRVFENKKYTFGLELETCSGLVPEDSYKDLNVLCIYDGSLKDEDGVARGGEYVTGVLTGDAGVNQLKKIVNTLVKSNCAVNQKCSVHVHIGSAKFSKKELLAMYMLGKQLEDEMYTIFPQSRADNVYCRPLGSILLPADRENLSNFKNLSSLEFDKLIDYLFDLRLFPYVKTGVPNANLPRTSSNYVKPSRGDNKSTPHPAGNKCGYDKNAQRYSWLNFVTCLYNNKGPNAKTLEFRLHNGTLNFKKILAWLKICVAFTWFAENHQDSIFLGYYLNPNTQEKEPITLALVLSSAYPKSCELLLQYIQERKDLFAKADKKSEALEYDEKINLVTSFKLKELFDF